MLEQQATTESNCIAVAQLRTTCVSAGERKSPSVAVFPLKNDRAALRQRPTDGCSKIWTSLQSSFSFCKSASGTGSSDNAARQTSLRSDKYFRMWYERIRSPRFGGNGVRWTRYRTRGRSVPGLSCCSTNGSNLLSVVSEDKVVQRIGIGFDNGFVRPSFHSCSCPPIVDSDVGSHLRGWANERGNLPLRDSPGCRV